MSDISREDEIIGANVKKFRESQGISRKDYNGSVVKTKI